MIARVRYGCWSSVAIAAAAVTVAACGSVRYPARYVLDIAPATLAPAPAPDVLGPLVVGALDCPPYLCEDRLVYRETPHQIGFYDYHRWAVRPRAALTNLLADRIRASSRFESVTVAGSPARGAYLLRGEIERFEEVDDKASVYAICTISAEVIDVKTGTAMWRGTASERVPVQQRDVPGLVAGLGAAAATVADRLAASIGDALPARLARERTARQ